MAGLTNIIARIKALVTADNKQFKKTMGDTERTAKKTGKSTGKSFKQMSGVIKAAVGAAIVAIGTKMVGALVKLNKSMALMSFKATAVFGLYRKDVEAMAEDTAASMGLTKTEFVNAAAGIQDLLIPIGFARKEATGMTKEMISLSGAMSAWTGGAFSAAQVGDIFAKAMLGEREQLKSLGIAISEAEIKTRLLEKGQSKFTGSTLAQAKAQATLELITEKSTDAQAAFEEEQDNIVITSAQVRANLKGIAEDMTAILAPALEDGTKLLLNLSNQLKEVTGGIAETAKSDIQFFDRLRFGLAKATGGFAGMVIQQEILNKNNEITTDHLRSLVEQLLLEGKTLDEVAARFESHGESVVNRAKVTFIQLRQLIEKDALETKDIEKAAYAERLAEQQTFYWALEGALMGHNNAMRGMWTEANNAQALALKESSGALEEYHNNLGLILEKQPLILPIIEATTTAQEAQRDQIKGMIQDWNTFTDVVGISGEMMTAVYSSMVQASDQAGATFASVAKAGLNSARQLIKAYIAEGVAVAIKSALVNVPFPFNVIAAGLAGGGAAALFGRLVPSFAEGGMVTGPTLAMVGDNPSGKEMIIPWEKLGEMGGGPVEVTGVLKGDTMFLQNKRFSEKLTRTGRG